MKAITARKGEAHITPLMDSMWHQGMTGAQSCTLGAYENFKADIISNNEIRVRSGIGMLQGRFFCIEPNTYDSVTINNGTQEENRIDLIVMRWTVDAADNTQKAETIVIQGEPVAGTPLAPSATEGSLDDGDLIVDYPLYEVHLEGINITEVVPLFTALPGIFLIAPGGVVDLAHGGHGGTTAAEAIANLGAMGKWELLWENASPTSEFPKQSISIGLAEYEFIIIVSDVVANNTVMQVDIAKLEETSRVKDLTYTGPASYVSGSTKGMNFKFRRVVTSTSSLFFSEGWILANAVSGEWTEKDANMVPYRIYGIKR